MHTDATRALGALCSSLIVGWIRRLACRLGRLGLPCCITSHPDSLADVVIAQLVVDAIGGKDDKVVLLRYLKRPDVGQGLDDIRVATSIFEFSLRVAKSPAD